MMSCVRSGFTRLMGLITLWLMCLLSKVEKHFYTKAAVLFQLLSGELNQSLFFLYCNKMYHF